MKRHPARTAANVDDVLWCYARLDDSTAQPATAPSAGAWSMLRWAREERSRFYTGVFPRALRAQVQAQVTPDGRLRSEEPPREEALEEFRDYEVEKTWLRMRGASDQLIADAEGLVADWADQVGVELPPQCACALVSGVAEAVQGAIEAASKNPAAFARYAVGRGADLQPEGTPST